MPRFAIACISFFDNEMEIHFLDGPSETEVVKRFLHEEKGLLIEDDKRTMIEIKQACFDADCMVAVAQLPATTTAAATADLPEVSRSSHHS